ncbi:sigma-E factor negative regulatory protein [Gallibacterium anatis]|uniref:sigma-E factor negative regulatory protein n=1 Tax=Gallibacterium anatis TaxID=750 RepID=UPI00223282FB|nr:sigma-E factor negative regulatory protein [Gallibacterium anatis]MDK9560616.1 sigma-E factor negative regulatory protein [Gallibacterium anatis]UZD15447.1 sigma-E factor negative regulatory protein [Gallibacterium anatis]
MQNREQLSAYMDGEDVERGFVESLCQDKALQQTWSTLHIARSVMRNESEVILDVSFTEKMAALIEAEPTVQLQEQPKPETVAVPKVSFWAKAKKYVMPVVQTAVAASVCLIAVFSIQNLNKGSETETIVSPALQTLPFTQSVQEVSYNVSHKNVPSKEQLEQQNKRLNEILQNYQLQRRLYSDLKAE